ncbi:hypothetical protein RND71_013898 [Anisodus tanguticus]|uniref:Uncharacterized protein n=1 Tax=Anisodus tanguticus TaxID=243964 RepID=A0AAE1SAX7_9SOLA|nr:hypothetical protein RND71_013898 [Anisodus tanguticus]
MPHKASGVPRTVILQMLCFQNVAYRDQFFSLALFPIADIIDSCSGYSCCYAIGSISCNWVLGLGTGALEFFVPQALWKCCCTRVDPPKMLPHPCGILQRCVAYRGSEHTPDGIFEKSEPHSWNLTGYNFVLPAKSSGWSICCLSQCSSCFHTCNVYVL